MYSIGRRRRLVVYRIRNKLERELCTPESNFSSYTIICKQNEYCIRRNAMKLLVGSTTLCTVLRKYIFIFRPFRCNDLHEISIKLSSHRKCVGKSNSILFYFTSTSTIFSFLRRSQFIYLLFSLEKYNRKQQKIFQFIENLDANAISVRVQCSRCNYTVRRRCFKLNIFNLILCKYK